MTYRHTRPRSRTAWLAIGVLAGSIFTCVAILYGPGFAVPLMALLVWLRHVADHHDVASRSTEDRESRSQEQERMRKHDAP